jgi:hypothetical protein
MIYSYENVTTTPLTLCHYYMRQKSKVNAYKLKRNKRAGVWLQCGMLAWQCKGLRWIPSATHSQKIICYQYFVLVYLRRNNNQSKSLYGEFFQFLNFFLSWKDVDFYQLIFCICWLLSIVFLYLLTWSSIYYLFLWMW